MDPLHPIVPVAPNIPPVTPPAPTRRVNRDRRGNDGRPPADDEPRGWQEPAHPDEEGVDDGRPHIDVTV